MIFSSLSSFAIANANQTLNSYVVDGTITTTGCKIIGGIIFNQTTLMMPIQICHHINHNFQISELPPHSGCIAVVRYWKDPDSGNVYAFGNPCIAPQFLDPSKGNLTDIRPIQSNSPLDSPLKQFKSGIAITDVKCSANYVLIIKAQDGSPVCVNLILLKS